VYKIGKIKSSTALLNFAERSTSVLSHFNESIETNNEMLILLEYFYQQNDIVYESNQKLNLTSSTVSNEQLRL